MERSSDNEFWNTSDNKGFDFGDSDFVLSSSVDDDPELMNVHLTDFQKHVGKEMSPLSPGSGSYSMQLESCKNLLVQDLSVLQISQKDLRSYGSRMPPEETVSNMIRGLSYCLENHKTMKDKMLLLDSAVKCHDGNAIMAVVLFLRKTLQKSVFHKQILERPEATNHYLSFLEMDNEYDELSNLYMMLGRAEDAAFLKYSSVLREPNPESKVKKLEKCLNTYFQMMVPPLFVNSLSEHICLLQRQLPIEKDDSRQEEERANEIFCMFPREITLIDASVITTLCYCCLYHYNLPENCLASPTAIKKQHQLTDKQFVWAALPALAKQKNWVEVENLFLLNKSWFGNKKLKCCIGFNKAVDVLGSADAPSEILLKYIELVKNMDEKMNLAKKYKVSPDV